MDKPRKYFNDFFLISYSQRIVANCNEIAFFNGGTATVLIANLFPVVPGAMISFDGKAGEFDTTSYQVSFTGSGTMNCIAIRKYYQEMVGSNSNTFDIGGNI